MHSFVEFLFSSAIKTNLLKIQLQLAFEKPLLEVRLGYCFTPYQRPRLYNDAPLDAFYDTLGIRRTYSRLTPPASSRGNTLIRMFLEVMCANAKHRFNFKITFGWLLIYTMYLGYLSFLRAAKFSRIIFLSFTFACMSHA